jgi:hypothetical protein
MRPINAYCIFGGRPCRTLGRMAMISAVEYVILSALLIEARPSEADDNLRKRAKVLPETKRVSGSGQLKLASKKASRRDGSHSCGRLLPIAFAPLQFCRLALTNDSS